MFRHKESPGPSPNLTPSRTLLDDTPSGIKSIIFEFKLEMEKFELSEKLNWEYQRQLELLMLENRNSGCITDREINDGLFAGDIKRKIAEKYGPDSTLRLHEYPLRFVTKVRFVSSMDGSLIDSTLAEDGLEPKDLLHMIAFELHEGVDLPARRAYQTFHLGQYSGDEYIKIEVSIMPYRFESGNTLVDGNLVLHLIRCEERCFIPKTDHLMAMGYTSTNESLRYGNKLCPICHLGAGECKCSLREPEDHDSIPSDD